MNVPPVIRRSTPQFVRRWRTHWQFVRTKWYFKELFRSRSMGDAFSEIYSRKAWGAGAGEEFYSGAGSRGKFAEIYADWLNHFVVEKGLHHIVDLGCGDFGVGRLLKTSDSVRYTGLDVVADLIRHNQERFQNAYVEFRCANIVEDELPDGDLCLIRQVLQHLSNKQISKVVAACSRYRYILITEDVWVGEKARPNLDKPAGWDTRIRERSGVYLDLPPFNLPARTVFEIPDSGTNALRTMLLEGHQASPAGGLRVG